MLRDGGGVLHSSVTMTFSIQASVWRCPLSISSILSDLVLVYESKYHSKFSAFRTRFYSFNFEMPFIHIYPSYVYLSDDGDVDITNENRDGYLTTENDFLALGKYTYIGHCTLFRVFLKTTCASQIKKNEFCATQNILPYIAKDKEEVRTMSIQILLNSHEYQQLLSKLFPTTKGQVSMAQQSELGVLQSSNETISVPVNAVLTDLPEIAQTKALCASIIAYFSKDFIINQIDATRGQQNLCKYSTSRPDICFCHNANFFLIQN